MENDYDRIFKVQIVGDSNTGKSILFERFREIGKWNSNFIPTIGVDFLKVILSVWNKKISLQVWDTAGIVRFRPMLRSYFRGAGAILIVYDVTNRDSFCGVHYWLEFWREFGERESLIFLIGNKCDLDDEREVSYEEGRLLAEENGFFFLETSAKTLENTNYLPKLVAKKLLEKVNQIEREDIEEKRISAPESTVEKKEENSKSVCNIW